MPEVGETLILFEKLAAQRTMIVEDANANDRNIEVYDLPLLAITCIEQNAVARKDVM
jgi:hypothetical protein